MKLLTLNELAQITKKGKTVFADDVPLKKLNLEQVSDNMVYYLEKQGNWFITKNKFFLYFVTNPEWLDMLQNDEADLLFFPHVGVHNMFHVSAITDIWKKNHLKNARKSEYVIGVVEGYKHDEAKEILVQMMSVKPGYKFNKINSLMMDQLREIYPDYNLVFDNPTEDGSAFIDKYMPDAKRI